MPYKLRGIAASKKRKLDVFISDETITPTRKCSHDWLHKKKSNKGPPEHEAEALPLVDTATTRFLELLKQDARRLPPSLPMRSKHGTDGTKCLLETHHVEFQLPFKQLEIKHLDERQWVRRPPPFGKISRCVYVSTKMPIADFPVHKCTCYEETHKSMTKRTTMMAKNVKAQRDLAVKGRHPFSRPADEEKDQVMVYCGEACYNRMLFISCSDDTCSVPDPSLCSNRAIKRREIKSVRVEYISGAGFGLIANSKIQAGNFIIEYVGEVIDNEECRRRMRKYQEQGEVNFYLMELEKNTVIDAKYRSNDSRFINHCCDPNSVTQKWNVDGIQRIGIFARRNIAVNEEITIDYNFSHFGEAAECKCGSTACTGKIGLKRSKTLVLNYRATSTTKPVKQTFVHEPPELKRPVHLTSLALLKSSQLDEDWLDYYGFKNRRLFLSHRVCRSNQVGANSVDDGERARHPLPLNSPVSVYSTTTEEDVSLTPPQMVQRHYIQENTRTSNWYDNVRAGKHLPQMKALHSYICGGKSDWTADFMKDASKERASAALRKKTSFPKKPGRPKKRTIPHLSRPHHVLKPKKLVYRRRNLLQARARGINELAAFANGTSKWNKRILASSTVGPDRIHRLIDRIKGTQMFVNTDQNDLNEDACFRCGLAGELLCCDACPAAFHLNCTNLAVTPPKNMPWFCSECINPKHLQKASEASDTGLITARGTKSSHYNASKRYLRSHVTPQAPSLKTIFHMPAPCTKRRYKKRHRALDRSYRELEHVPLPVWNESGGSEMEP